MTHVKALGVGLLVAALAVVGCSPQGGTKTESKQGATETGKARGGHTHGKGPHGGVVIDLAAYHAEITVDHKNKEMTVYMLGDDEKTPVAVSAKELTVTTKEAKTKEGKVVEKMTITLSPADAKDGKASKFVGTDPGLEPVADHEGTVFGTIDGKFARGKFKE